MPRYFVGLDLGQAQDPSAIAVLEKVWKLTEEEWIERENYPDVGELIDRAVWSKPIPPAPRPPRPATYHCVHLERLPLGTRYDAQVAHVKDLLNRHPLKGNSALVIDRGGVGRAVYNMFTAAGITAVPVTITGGDKVNHEDGWRVPKRELVSVLQSLLQPERIKFAGTLPDTPVLVQEMLNFQVKITDNANDVYAAREGKHDDLVLAVALAAWWGERYKEPQRAPEHVTYHTYG